MKNSKRKFQQEVASRDKKEAAIERQYKLVEKAEKALDKQVQILWMLVKPTDEEVDEAGSQISQMDEKPTDLEQIRMVLQLRSAEEEAG